MNKLCKCFILLQETTAIGVRQGAQWLPLFWQGVRVKSKDFTLKWLMCFASLVSGLSVVANVYMCISGFENNLDFFLLQPWTWILNFNIKTVSSLLCCLFIALSYTYNSYNCQKQFESIDSPSISFKRFNNKRKIHQI